MNNKYQIPTLLFIIFFSVMGTAMPYTIFAPMFINHGDLFSASIDSNIALNLALGITLAAYPLGQFLGAPIIGRFSDIFGRKKILLYTLFCAGFGYILSALAIYSGNIYYLVISRFITGVLEANFAVAQAFIIDITKDKQKDLGKLSAVISMAYVIGPIIGAILCNSSIVSWFNYATPFLFTSIGSFVLVVMVSKLLYENHNNLDKEKIQINFYEQINIFKNLSNIIKNTSVKWILVSSSFLSLSIMTYYEFFPIILASSWKMSSIYIAYMTAIYSISLCIGALYLPSFLNKRYSKNVSILCILVIMIIGYFLLITDYITLVYLQFVILGLAYGAVNNLMMVMLSDEARPDQQGEVLGFRMSFAMLGSAIICLVGGLIISLSVKIVILLCCIFTLVSILAIVFLTNYHSESN
ncbi:MFS transporter [Francisella adeliensis]|uniref:MFS transporter n=1 Tax=Francisella adeliensis TaxID=2007306 RepID=A0A2Z4XYU9_9GAMM|nr:MFS transporter [Francisella adeliensis]AXA33808.1 hypothetical protein CDH04_04980 [Francisella adeliensis]MBK2085707.1 MFS transporter [Francisella adeliensis]MBK2097585.1 MFS transporter [Francisella adeliensis]QIW12043.1 MFS transporter [Francisella adeliensis]QIW13918.1 MFS transporter [Francisella adeliensis]